MVYRAFSLFLVALALVLFASAPLHADDKNQAAGDKATERGNTHEGTVVSVTADTLVMKSKATNGEQAKEHSHKLADNAKVMCDGKTCKLQDLKPGQKIRVTTKKGDRKIVVKVEALDKNQQFDKGFDKNTETKETIK